MINYKEARAGNLVMYDNRLFQIEAISKSLPCLNTDEFGVGVVDWNNIAPIPLTFEIAKKIGLQVDAYCVWGRIELPNSPNVLTVNIGGGMGHGTVWLRNSLIGVNLPSIIHVHHIQNLYYHLTGGKELIYTP